MQVSVEILEGLKRKLTITVPAADISLEVESRINNLARTAKMDGFRPGHIPRNIVVSRFSKQVLNDVARDIVQPTLIEALKKEALVLAGPPSVEPVTLEEGQDFCYHAFVEILPDVQPNELSKDTAFTLFAVDISAEDVARGVEELQLSHATWTPVSRPATKGDRVKYELKEDEAEASANPLALGEESLILGKNKTFLKLEDVLMGCGVSDKPIRHTFTFPDDHHSSELAGKTKTFLITVKEVEAPQLPELDDNFSTLVGLPGTSLQDLEKELRLTMVRAANRELDKKNHRMIFDAFLACNTFDIPESMVDEEIERLNHEMYHQVFGNAHSENEKIPTFPRELFEEKAQRRVRLGLLISAYVKQHGLQVTDALVDEKIEVMAQDYIDPNLFRQIYKNNPEARGNLEMAVMEDLVAKTIAEKATVSTKAVSYNALMTTESVSQEQESIA